MRTNRTITVTSAMTGQTRVVDVVEPIHRNPDTGVSYNPNTGYFGCHPVAITDGRVSAAEAAEGLHQMLTRAGVTIGHDHR